MAPTPSTIMALEPIEHPGAAIVIDVIRAFTTAAAAFDAGATEIRGVESLDAARALRDQTSSSLLMGESVPMQVSRSLTSTSTSSLASTTSPSPVAAAALG